MSAIKAISLVVPIYNEEGNLERLFAEIRAALAPQELDWEVVFVDDGSSDASLEIIRELAERHCELRYLAFAQNQGQSAAFCAGFDAARHDVVVTLDADLQNDPADIPAMLAKYAEGYDMIIGWRAKRKDSWAKRWASRVGNAIRRRITRDTVRDTGCSLKVMRRDMLLRLPRFKNMHRYLPPLMLAQGARIEEVKVNHRPRHQGQSKYGTWDRAVAGAYDLFGVRWLLKRAVRYQIKDSNI
jgi:glycosyltransferase involved in cell wall biosynthesis